MNTVPLPPRFDKCSIEFQGGLIQVSYRDASAIHRVDGAFFDQKLKDRYYVKRFRAAAALLPADQRHYVGGDLVGADMSPEMVASIEAAAWDDVRQYLKSRAKRGAVQGFSAASRRRMQRQLARLKKSVSGLFVTVTYRKLQRDHKLAKSHLDKLTRWLKRRFPDSAIVWRMEYQKRGSIHFHLIVLGAVYLDAAEITAYWQNMTGDESYPDVRRLDGRAHVLRYISKYLAKLPDQLRDEDRPQRFSEDGPHVAGMDDGAAADGFNNAPYSEIEAFIGRFWGVVNRDKLPMADGVQVVFGGDARLISELRRYARRHWSGMSKRIQGFTLFCDADQWLRLWRFVLDDSWLPFKVSEYPL